MRLLRGLVAGDSAVRCRILPVVLHLSGIASTTRPATTMELFGYTTGAVGVAMTHISSQGYRSIGNARELELMRDKWQGLCK
jgi:hypothetical protein